jgi:hypothetical protein
MSNEVTEIKTGEIVNIKETELDKDLSFGREQLIDIVKTGSEAVAELAVVCKQSGDRVDYEKLALLMRSTAEVIKDLSQISQTRDVLNRPPEPPPETHTTNQVFVGSTSDMVEMLRQLKEKNE